MFKFFLLWILANYSYENISNTYKSYKTENPIREMSEFIDKQQFREDQLRDHCNLQNFKMKDKIGYYDIILDTIKQPFHIFKNNNYYIMSSDEVLIVSTKEELLSFGYLFTNVNKEVTYDGQTFLLTQCGVRSTLRLPLMGYSKPFIMPRNPQWTIKLGDLTLVVTDII